jgi:hypothetical protein
MVQMKQHKTAMVKNIGCGMLARNGGPNKTLYTWMEERGHIKELLLCDQ